MDKFNLISINADGIGRVGEVLLEKISQAVGACAAPWQKKRIAHADAEVMCIEARGTAEAAGIAADSQFELEEKQQRAVQRFVAEETRKQENIKDITQLACAQLNEKGKPDDVDDDWIVNFFEKCRIVSNKQMQKIWASLLAGEANVPGSISKQTVNVLANMDLNDALLFDYLCMFTLSINEYDGPFIFNTDDKIYEDNKVTFENIAHLENMGLISFAEISNFSYTSKNSDKYFTVKDNIRSVIINLKKESIGSIEIGKVLLSRPGKDLLSVRNDIFIENYLDYAIKKWQQNGHTVSTISSNKQT